MTTASAPTPRTAAIPPTMRAAVMEAARQPMVIQERAVPPIGPDEVLIRITAAGVCHTDLHLSEGLFETVGINPFPVVPGHEIVGVVERIGAAVTVLAPGDRVGAYWVYSCGRCLSCLSGEEQACPRLLTEFPANGVSRQGGYAQYLALPASHALPLPDELDFVAAAPLFCAGLTMYGALKNAQVRPGQRVAVLGIGGLGHLGLAIARAMGAEVIALTSTAAKADLAREMGARQVLYGTADIGAQLQANGGADVVVSTTIEPAAIAAVMVGLRPRGALVLTGVTMEPLPLVPTFLAFGQQRVIGSLIGSRRDMVELLQLAAQAGIRPLTETYPLAEANAVHERLRANQVRFRAVLLPE